MHPSRGVAPGSVRVGLAGVARPGPPRRLVRRAGGARRASRTGFGLLRVPGRCPDPDESDRSRRANTGISDRSRSVRERYRAPAADQSLSAIKPRAVSLISKKSTIERLTGSPAAFQPVISCTTVGLRNCANSSSEQFSVRDPARHWTCPSSPVDSCNWLTNSPHWYPPATVQLVWPASADCRFVKYPRLSVADVTGSSVFGQGEYSTFSRGR